MPDRDENAKNKTLSLKLGSKPILSPKKNIEAGKTVIVEKKRVKKNSPTEYQNEKTNTNNIKLTDSANDEVNIVKKKKSGVILKPLSKDEQKKILKAENKKDKNNEIEKIRTRDQSNFSNYNNEQIQTREKINPDKRFKKDVDRKKKVKVRLILRISASLKIHLEEKN